MSSKIAQLYAEVDVQDGNFKSKMGVVKAETQQTDNAFNRLKGTLKGGLGGDKALDQLKTSVSKATRELQKSQIALDTYKLKYKNASSYPLDFQRKLDMMSLAVESNKLALNNSRLALGKYQDGIAKTTSAMAAFGISGKMLAGLTAVGVTVGLASAGKQALQTAGDFEQLGIAFEVLIGNAQKSKQFTTELINLANVTPMTTQGLADNARLLLAFGENTENIIPDLRMLGDVAGGNQVRLDRLALVFGQIGQRGRLTGDNLRQIAELGFNPLNIIAKKTGESVAQVTDRMEKGNVSFSEFKQTLISATSEGGRFYGMMDKQSKSLQGRLSTLADKWTLVAKAIGDKFMPMAKSAVEWLISLGDAALKASARMDHLTERIGVAYQNMGKIDMAKLKGGSLGIQFASSEETNSTLKKLDKQVKVFKNIEKQYNDIIAEKESNGEETGIFDGQLKKYTQLRINAEKEFNAAKSKLEKKTDKGGFQDSGKGDTKKKGKSADTLLNEKANELKAQSDLEIAQNNYTDAQILQKKIELQEKLITIFKSTSTKGKTEQLQAQTELLNLEKQYQDQVLEDKIKALQNEATEKKIYAQMDTTDQLNNVSLTEEQRQDIKNKSTVAQLQAEVNLQQQILELKRRGVTDLAELSQKEREDYETQLLNKLNAEKAYQDELAGIKEQERTRNGQIATSVSDTITDGLKSAIDGTKTLGEAFSDMLATMAIDLARSAIKTQLENLLNLNSNSSITSGGVSSGGNFLSTVFGVGKKLLGFASGGTPPVNRPSLVGEEGPELFVPRTNGTIIPADQTANALNGGGGNPSTQSVVPIVISQNISTLDSRSFQQYYASEGKSTMADMLVDMVRTDYRGVRRAFKGI